MFNNLNLKFVLLVLLAVLVLPPVHTDTKTRPENQFKYALGAENVQKPVTIESSDLDWNAFSGKLQFLFIPIKNAYLYLLLFDNQERIHLLFPYSFEQFLKPEYTTFPKYYIPDDWPVNDSEPCRIYFLVSRKRIVELESLLNTYGKLQNDPGKTNKGIYAKILSQIHAVERSFYLGDNQPVIIPPAGGSAERDGNSVSMEWAAATILFDEYYVKSYTIR